MDSFTPQRVSVVIPVHNGGCYLADTIQSVLGQTLHPVEIIVVDDGSTDDSAALAESFGPPVRVLYQTNLGPAAARNAGEFLASGDLLAFLDADDRWAPDKLARQVRVLRDDPSCEAVLGGVENFISPEVDEVQRQLLAHSAARTGAHLVGALLVHRAAFRRIGPFDTRWRQGEFIEWWARAVRTGLSCKTIPELVLRRRLHTNNMMLKERNECREYVAILRQHIARQREAVGKMIDLP